MRCLKVLSPTDVQWTVYRSHSELESWQSSHPNTPRAKREGAAGKPAAGKQPSTSLQRSAFFYTANHSLQIPYCHALLISLLGTLCSYGPFSCPPSGPPEPPGLVKQPRTQQHQGKHGSECQPIRGYASLSTPTGLSWRPSQKLALSGPPAIYISAHSCRSDKCHPPWRKISRRSLGWVILVK